MKLLLKVKTTINHDDLKKRAIEKHSHHDQSFCGLEEYTLLYPDGKEALFLPGITTTRFQRDSYKEELEKLYSQIVLYLCSTKEFDNVSCDTIEFNPDLSCLCQESIPIILTKFMKVKFLSSLMIKIKNLIYL